MSWIKIDAEQAIRRMKMRSRTVRSYKSWQGMWAALLLAGSGAAFEVLIGEGNAYFVTSSKTRQPLMLQKLTGKCVALKRDLS